MLNPDALIAAWVAKLRNIPQLVTALGGDSAAIQGYFDQFPDQSNIRAALLQQPPGSILVVFMGTDKARVGTAFQFRHKFSFQVRAPEVVAGGVSYGALWSLFVNGVPITDNPGNLSLLHYPIHGACMPMDFQLPQAQRSSILTDVNGGTLDLFEIQASLVETGDNTG
jgi:hypothetical protein